MRALLLLLLVMPARVTSLPCPYADWGFNENEGTTVGERAGVVTGLQLSLQSLQGQPAQWVQDVATGALGLSFPASVGDRSVLGGSASSGRAFADPFIETNQLSVEAWLSTAPTTVTPGGRVLSIGGDPDTKCDQSTSGRILLQLYNRVNVAGDAAVYPRIAADAAECDAFTSYPMRTSLALSGIAHYVFTVDFSTKVTKLYRNGQLEGEVTLPSQLPATMQGHNLESWDDVVVLVGNGASGDRQYWGEVYGIKAWNVLLTLTDVQELHAAGVLGIDFSTYQCDARGTQRWWVWVLLGGVSTAAVVVVVVVARREPGAGGGSAVPQGAQQKDQENAPEVAGMRKNSLRKEGESSLRSVRQSTATSATTFSVVQAVDLDHFEGSELGLG